MSGPVDGTPGDPDIMDDSQPRDTPERPGVWIAVDVGTVRVGVARCDPMGVLAVPVTTLRRNRRDDSDIAELAALVRQHEAVGVVVGLPRTLGGREGPSVVMAREYGGKLRTAIAPVSVEYLDERLTTVSAQRKLRDGGVRGPAGRAVIDQMAAVEILQHWLDLRRR